MFLGLAYGGYILLPLSKLSLNYLVLNIRNFENYAVIINLT